MKINKEEFVEILYNEAKARKIELSPIQLEKLYIYKEFLKEENEKFNLTKITDDMEIIFKHFIDSLEITKQINQKSNIADIGSGAGFPGIIVAIFFEDMVSMTLIESNNKKSNFLKEVIKEIKLKNCLVLNQRVEDILIKDIKYRESFDFVLSRAVAPLNILIEYSIPLLKIDGKALLMKGPGLKEELLASKNAFLKLDCVLLKEIKYNIKIGDELFFRTIAVIKKINKTDKKYPRSYSKIKKLPL